VRGPVLPHEHLVLDLRRPGDPAAQLDAASDGSAVTGELAALRAEFGLGLVVEQSCRGMGRQPWALAAISRASGVPVIASTGWYAAAFHPAETAAGVERMTELLVDDVLLGMDGTTVTAGLIGEVGSGEHPTPAEARALRAAARAALRSGLSVATHAALGRGGLAQAELLLGEGLPAHRIALGHQDLLDDSATHRALAAAGCYVALDTIGKTAYQDDAVRLRLLLKLLEAGHAERILLSNDVSRRGYLRREGGAGYGAVLREFLPQVRAAGVDEASVDLITRANPLRFLSGGGETG
jgi:phosphotriesterase-related protein